MESQEQGQERGKGRGPAGGPRGSEPRLLEQVRNVPGLTPSTTPFRRRRGSVAVRPTRVKPTLQLLRSNDLALLSYLTHSLLSPVRSRTKPA